METAGPSQTPSSIISATTAKLDKRQRRITFNGRPLNAEQQSRLEALEENLGLSLPDRDYLCDPKELWADCQQRS